MPSSVQFSILSAIAGALILLAPTDSGQKLVGISAFFFLLGLVSLIYEGWRLCREIQQFDQRVRRMAQAGPVRHGTTEVPVKDNAL